MTSVVLDSIMTCPACGFATTETMPTDACQARYQYTACGEMLKPKPGDCCVFCSHGSVPRPPIQLERRWSHCGQSFGHIRDWRHPPWGPRRGFAFVTYTYPVYALPCEDDLHPSDAVMG